MSLDVRLTSDIGIALDLIPRRFVVGVLCGFAVASAAAPVHAQTLSGTVLEEGRGVPVAGAMISLLDRDGERRTSAMADSLGRFSLAPPEAGEYVIETVRIGYETSTSPLLALSAEGEVDVELMMTPLPIGLEGFEVSVEREAEIMLEPFGLTPATLRNRWIDRTDIEAMNTPGLPKDVIRWRNISGVTVDEYDTFDDGVLCVRFRRSERACAITVLNGALVPPEAAFHINAGDIEAMAILTPEDATTFYGTPGGGGAVLIWTRAGGR